jgi:hypothetical protein
MDLTIFRLSSHELLLCLCRSSPLAQIPRAMGFFSLVPNSQGNGVLLPCPKFPGQWGSSSLSQIPRAMGFFSLVPNSQGNRGFLSCPKFPGQWGSFPGGKAVGRREVNHSPPSRAQVKDGWSYTSTPPYVFMQWIGKIAPSFTVTNYVTAWSGFFLY